MLSIVMTCLICTCTQPASAFIVEYFIQFINSVQYEEILRHSKLREHDRHRDATEFIVQSAKTKRIEQGRHESEVF